MSACLRCRTDTVPCSASRPPTTSMYGTFCSCASRIFRFTFSLRSSSVTRMPAVFELVAHLLRILESAGP